MIEKLKFSKWEIVEFVIIQKVTVAKATTLENVTNYKAVSLNTDFYNNQKHINTASRGIEYFSEDEFKKLIEELKSYNIPFKII